MLAKIQWRWRHFEVFDTRAWHEILSLRIQVFVVEQNCAYCDPDSKDPNSWHLEGRLNGELVATLRALPPGLSYRESSIGRVVVCKNQRGTGLGQELMCRGIEFNQNRWPGSIRISGQAYLKNFYEELGFIVERGPYMEDNIPHYEMLLA